MGWMNKGQQILANKAKASDQALTEWNTTTKPQFQQQAQSMGFQPDEGGKYNTTDTYSALQGIGATAPKGYRVSRDGTLEKENADNGGFSWGNLGKGLAIGAGVLGTAGFAAPALMGAMGGGAAGGGAAGAAGAALPGATSLTGAALGGGVPVSAFGGVASLGAAPTAVGGGSTGLGFVKNALTKQVPNQTANTGGGGGYVEKIGNMLGGTQGIAGLGAGIAGGILDAKSANADRKSADAQFQQQFDLAKQTSDRDFKQYQAELGMQYGQGDPFTQAKARAKAALMSQLLTSWKAPTYDGGTGRWTGGMNDLNPDVIKGVSSFYDPLSMAAAEQAYNTNARSASPTYASAPMEAMGYSPDILQKLAAMLAAQKGGAL